MGVAFAIEVTGQVASNPVDDFQGCSLVHVRQEEPFFVVVILKCQDVCLDIRFTLSLKYPPVFWVSIKPIRKGDVLLDRGCSSSGGSSGGMYLQVIQDGSRIVKMYVQGLK